MNKTLLIIFLLLPIIAIADEKVGDQIRYVDEQDKAMTLAIKKAKKQLDDFFKIVKNPPIDSSDFKLKVMISDSNGVEHLWFTPFKEIKGGYAGILANTESRMLLSVIKLLTGVTFRAVNKLAASPYAHYLKPWIKI